MKSPLPLLSISTWDRQDPVRQLMVGEVEVEPRGSCDIYPDPPIIMVQWKMGVSPIFVSFRFEGRT